MDITSLQQSFSRHRTSLIAGSAAALVTFAAAGTAGWMIFGKALSESHNRQDAAVTKFRELAARQNGRLQPGQRIEVQPEGAQPVTATYQGVAVDVMPDRNQPALCHVVQTRAPDAPPEYSSFGCRPLPSPTP